MKNKMKRWLAMGLVGMLALSPVQAQQQETFKAGDGTFLLNGKPFVVKAAEMHYPRIPAPYWEQRIEMCKALGMNTICLYIFWNLHEQEEGVFDFSGNKDISKFCKLAQKHGMYVIVRPGPYVCAEWEMGGLPWWLLKKKGIKLRSLDPYYMEHVKKFMKEVGKQLADQQLSRGGNIIMTQVENEFGAYGNDKPYVAAIRDIVKEAGFTDVQLFQCDWSSTFQTNGLDDLLWTINFGTGANIEEQFKALKAARPNSPMMCSEYWSGWFDNWGRGHETRNAKAMVDGIRDMLDRNISFSLYMTHGGTTFGWWGGANNPAYSSMCSSYDYDAPISEAGWITPKYNQLRELLQQYQPEGTKLPEPPQAYPTIEVPAITNWEVAPLFANLPEPKSSKEMKSMEWFDQPWGSILYRTTLKEDLKGVLHIDEVHDWAQVFVDGKLIGRLDRRKAEYTLPLKETLRKGAQLDILVESMGRVNFGQSIHDYKGISNKVEVVNDGQPTLLEDWKVYNLRPEYKYVKKNKFVRGKAMQAPAYYRATFKLKQTGDTFLDMQTWGKGLVWVNGHALGRFWEIGPQQTLYMPGCWLKKGKNEIIVLDLKGPAAAQVVGHTKPIIDMLRLSSSQLHRQQGESLSLAGEQPVAEGTFEKKAGWQEVKFDKSVKGRYFCLNALSNYEGNRSAIAELEVLGADGKPMPREHWKMVYADSEETENGNCTADKIYDLQESTYWQTTATSPLPHHFVLDLGEETEVTGFQMLPRAEKGMPGLIREYAVYVKGKDFTRTKDTAK